MQGKDILTDKEIDAIRFYQGDIRRKGKDGKLLNWVSATGFFGIPKAYKTMNCLMFDGINNEKERLEEGTENLNPQIILEIEKVTDVFADIFRAMCKYSKSQRDNKRSRIVYRTDRGASVDEMKAQARTISFTSTSKENHPKEYFQKKKRLTLLEIVIPIDIPYLDIDDILGDENLYADQKEILLPPFLYASFQEGRMTDEEVQYRDADGQPPYVKYIVYLEKVLLQSFKVEEGKQRWRMGDLSEKKENAALILEKLKRKEEISEQEFSQYCLFKNIFKEIIIEKFSVIENEEYAGMKSSIEVKRNLLIKDVKEKIVDFDIRRKLYRRRTRVCNITLAILSVIPMVCISLSFVKEIDLLMKGAAIVASAGAMITTRILKVEAYPLKLFQRTKTYLSLRDLSRQLKYEQRWDEQRLDEYLQLFRKIMKDDTEMSWQNLQLQIENERELFQEEIIS